MRGREHEALMPAVAELLAECAMSAERIKRVVCGAGPGSFTSLRIAGSIAKGIAMAVGASLVPISSLALLVASHQPRRPGRYLAALDAMRGEHYVQLFEVDDTGNLLTLEKLAITPSSLVDRFAEERSATALGPNRAGSDAVVPHASAAASITKLIDTLRPAALAGWEPDYGRLAEAQVKWEAVHGPLQPR
jgi:tRNA threonylcarbamoyl adenosine modification protein YeaZ